MSFLQEDWGTQTNTRQTTEYNFHAFIYFLPFIFVVHVNFKFIMTEQCTFALKAKARHSIGGCETNANIFGGEKIKQNTILNQFYFGSYYLS